jgi:hydroxymethylpyrimidine pyrophosphatase-like HAD family hydrolase
MAEPYSSAPPLLAEHDLLMTCAQLSGNLATHLPFALDRQHDEQGGSITRSTRLLDCFLMAAGLAQMLEDRLHRDVGSTRKVARAFRRLDARLGSVAAGVDIFGETMWRGRRHLREEKELAVPLARLAWVSGWLAEAVVGEGSGDTGMARRAMTKLVSEQARTIELLASPPVSVSQEILRLPSCFRAYDQRPDDSVRLAERFSRRWPERDRPLMVVGVRTSGCYLAPLQASALRTLGYLDLSWGTFRPDQRGSPGWQEEIPRWADGGLFLVVDDPPVSGRSLVATLNHLIHSGISSRSLVVMVQSFSEAGAATDETCLPGTLADYQAVVLPWSEWSIHELLGKTSVTALLADASTGPVDLTRLDTPARAGSGSDPGADRRHTYVHYLLRRPGAPPVQVKAGGVGTGYLGRQALAVGRALEGWTPPIIATGEGVMVREWLDRNRHLSEADLHTECSRVTLELARYVDERRRRLGTGQDASRHLVDRQAAWEEIGRMVGLAFGRAQVLVRLLSRRLGRILLACEHPTVLDGAMELSNWFWASEPDGPRLQKIAFFKGSFSNYDLHGYDPVSDLAALAASGAREHVPELAGPLRDHYETLSGRPVDPERWFLYRMFHHWVRHERLVFAAGSVGGELALPHRTAACREEACMDQLFTDYVSELYFADVAPPESGPLSAIDLDGVLETHWLAFGAMAPAGALALRALSCHGHRAVLATGRSLDDLVRRCEAYRLTGGVAEYGSVVYDHRSRRSVDLLRADQHQALVALSSVLDGWKGVFVDPAYGHSVRASLMTERGGLVSLGPDRAREAIETAGVSGVVRTVHGINQTDFVCTGIDKGTGVTALADLLRAHSSPLLEMAIGDTVSDLPVLGLARRRFAPANASDELGSTVLRLPRPAQLGVFDAVTQMLGHKPGNCDRCRLATLRPGAKVLIAALGALPGGHRARLRATAEFSRALANLGG